MATLRPLKCRMVALVKVRPSHKIGVQPSIHSFSSSSKNSKKEIPQQDETLSRNSTRSAIPKRAIDSREPSNNKKKKAAEDAAALAARFNRPEFDNDQLKHLYQFATKDLSAFDPVYDIHPGKSITIPADEVNPYEGVVQMLDTSDFPGPSQGGEEIRSNAKKEFAESIANVTGMDARDINNLFSFALLKKRTVNMTAKGRIRGMYCLVVVGNGKGLVGYGEGSDSVTNRAREKAFAQAVRSMDYVERFEERTVWSTMQENFGTCKIAMRPRPPGFGLRTNHYIHQVAKAAGISDLSAKVYGSRNGMRVIKLAIAMLHGGHMPVDMGGFQSDKGHRSNKIVACGMQTADEVARNRGRSAILSR